MPDYEDRVQQARALARLTDPHDAPAERNPEPFGARLRKAQELYRLLGAPSIEEARSSNYLLLILFDLDTPAEWQWLTGTEWARLLRQHPEQARCRCWRNISGEQWLHLMQDQPRLIDVISDWHWHVSEDPGLLMLLRAQLAATTKAQHKKKGRHREW